MSPEKRVLPVADRMILQQCSGFIDIDKINQDAWPALLADLSVGEQGIVSLAFGYTSLFQSDKPVKKAQAAVAHASSEACDVVSEINPGEMKAAIKTLNRNFWPVGGDGNEKRLVIRVGFVNDFDIMEEESP
nr:plectin-like isoform X5 [Tanacetum cinerariifolium]